MYKETCDWKKYSEFGTKTPEKFEEMIEVLINENFR